MDNSKIIKIGSKAYKMLVEADGSFLIHSVFNRAVNLLYKEDYLLTILPYGYGCNTQSVIVSNEFFNYIKAFDWSSRQIFTLSMKEYISPNHLVDLSAPENLNTVEKRDIYNNIRLCMAELNSCGNTDGIAGFMFGNNTIYGQQLMSKINNMDLYLHNRATDKIAESLICILGMGPGLTPSGDDFIYGFLSALYYYNKFIDNSRTELYKLIDLIVRNAKVKTTIISYNMLRACQGGEFNEPIRKFLIGILTQTTNITSLLSEVLKIGSSSGSDITAGILYCMNILVEKEEENELKMSD